MTMATDRKTAFSSVPTDEHGLLAAEEVVVMSKEVRSNDNYGISWTDTFYDNETDIIAVFDVDYEQVGRHISGAKFWVFPVVLVYSFPVVLVYSMVMALFFSAGDADRSHYLWMFVFFFVLSSVWMMVHTIPGAFKIFNFQLENMYGIHVAVTGSGLRRDSRNFPLGTIFKTTTVVSIWNYFIDLCPFLYFFHISLHHFCVVIVCLRRFLSKRSRKSTSTRIPRAAASKRAPLLL
jgi:hypothetical protein